MQTKRLIKFDNYNVQLAKIYYIKRKKFAKFWKLFSIVRKLMKLIKLN